MANGIMTGDWLWASLLEGEYFVAGVDIFWIITGLCALGGWAAIRRPSDKNGNSHKLQIESETSQKDGVVRNSVGSVVEPSLNLKTPPSTAS